MASHVADNSHEKVNIPETEEDSLLIVEFSALVGRVGRTKAAELLDVDRKTIASWLRRDQLTSRMRDAIHRGLREARADLPATDVGRLDDLAEQVADLTRVMEDFTDQIAQLSRRVDLLEQQRALVPVNTVVDAPRRRWWRLFR